MSESRYLLVGLGNPGREYQTHRHNVGFMVMDRLAAENGLTFSRQRCQALAIDGSVAGKAVILAKPQTYMNKSGLAVDKLMRFYKISLDRLLVVHDDLDLDFGALRFRAAGSSGGHQGINSIIERLGSREFPRLRLGIGRPPGQMDPAVFVLKPFSVSQEPVLDLMLAQAVEGIYTFLREGITLAMSRHNRNVGQVIGEKDTGPVVSDVDPQ